MEIKFKKINTKIGSSLIEIMIYLSIFTALSILVINSFIVVLSSFDETNMNRKILESGTLSMERMSREIRQAESINANTTGTSLELNSHDGAGADMIVRFIGENGELNFYKNNILEGNLLGENLSIVGLSFRRITTTESEAVKIEMSIQYSQGNNIKTENFYNTIVLRGGY